MRHEPPIRYESRSKQLRADEIDAYVKHAINELRAEFEPAGRPFTMYHGCTKEDEQIVQVCLPTATGHDLTDSTDVAFTVARGRECAYPQILEAYDAVVEYAQSIGRTLFGVPRETYLNGPDDPNPVMEVAFPLARD